MTKFKVCAKMHLFIIISSLLIAIGLAVGTVCHFCAGGFFNYGEEFSSYTSVTVTYYSSEYKDEGAIKPECDSALKGYKPYEVSSAETVLGGELVYKFSPKTDIAKLRTAVEALNVTLDKNNSGLNVASVHEGTVDVGGSRAITFAAIALSAAAAFQFIYFVFRYKLRAAFSALLANVHNLGVFVALAALTRMPLGIQAVTVGCIAVLVTMILSCVFFDRTRKNFADEKYSKTARLEVVDASACEVRLTTVIALAAIAIAVVLFGVFAAIAQLWIGALAACGLALLALIACAYGTIFFTPAVHGLIDAACEKVKAAKKSPKKETAEAAATTKE